jgi:hypothetical protein
MAETLGSLCDKLTIVKLKQYHTDDEIRLNSLHEQSKRLQDEIDIFLSDALKGNIELNKLTFQSNKVYKKEGNETNTIAEGIASVFSQLAEVNCKLWHEVEKGYDIKNIPVDEKDTLINALAVLNLERNKCIDAIDNYFKELIIKSR